MRIPPVEKIISVALAVCAVSLVSLFAVDTVFLKQKIWHKVQENVANAITVESFSSPNQTSVGSASYSPISRWTRPVASAPVEIPASLAPASSSTPMVSSAPLLPPGPKNTGVVTIPVIMYHHIRDWKGVEAFGDYKTERGLRVGPTIFERHLQYIEKNGYTTITATELDAYYMGRGVLPAKPIMLTFDDGYVDNYENAFPLLKKYNMKGDFAIITGVISSNPAYMTWEELKEMLAAGMGISSHTVSHCQFAIKNPNVAQKSVKPYADSPIDETYRACGGFISPEQLKSGQVRYELSESKKELETKLGIEVPAIVYPYGNYNAQVIQIAKDIGYRQGYTILPEKNEEIDLGNPFELTRYRGFGQDDSATATLQGFFNGGR